MIKDDSHIACSYIMPDQETNRLTYIQIYMILKKNILVNKSELRIN